MIFRGHAEVFLTARKMGLRRQDAPIIMSAHLQRGFMLNQDGLELVGAGQGEMVLCTVSETQGAAVARVLSAAGVECRLVPDSEGFVVLVEETDAEIAELLLAKRKKDVEEEEESDDEEGEEDDDLEEDEDEDDDFDDEDEDEFEEEFGEDELDDDDDDIFYDDDEDE